MAVQSNITLPIVGPDVPRIILGVTGYLIVFVSS